MNRIKEVLGGFCLIYFGDWEDGSEPGVPSPPPLVCDLCGRPILPTDVGVLTTDTANPYPSMVAHHRLCMLRQVYS